ncbi:hypothetical protein BMS3Abin17_00747 [archaeon BMS3Abin17]|nr:hypothetical protein BMS3Abin17_00747 [archaeon BMS3Abin17]HDZ60880.1 hypothetical protein [Candidatus Pacearchaeota archaeon]
MTQKKLKELGIFFSILVFAILVVSPVVMAIQPTGGTVTEERSERAPADTAGTDNAIAGNISEVSVVGISTTQTWQGYFGNISGTIQLADSSDNVLYNWSLADPRGEIYASTNETISWTNIQCFNFTADGSYTGESGNGGTTSLYGTNLTTLEGQFSIISDGVDGVDETFTLSGAGTHNLFYTANQEFSEGECISTRVYGDTGAGVNDEFEEVLLYEPATSSVIYTSLIESTNVLGFDTNDYDFEMLVLEDGHGTDTSTTTYYFFVELE